MKDRYSFTDNGLSYIALAGLRPDVVWSVLGSARRLVRPLSATRVAVFGVAKSGQHLVVAVEESAVDDNDWDITGARLMDRDEIAAFEKFTGR